MNTRIEEGVCIDRVVKPIVDYMIFSCLLLGGLMRCIRHLVGEEHGYIVGTKFFLQD